LKLLDQNAALYLKYSEKGLRHAEGSAGPLDGWCDLCDKLNDPAEPARVSIHVTPVWLCYPEESLIKTQKCWWSVTLLTESSSHPSKETFKRTNGTSLISTLHQFIQFNIFSAYCLKKSFSHVECNV
jgi:hypothetical protein